MISLVEKYLSDVAWRNQISKQCRDFAVRKLAWPIVRRLRDVHRAAELLDAGVPESKVAGAMPAASREMRWPAGQSSQFSTRNPGTGLKSAMLRVSRVASWARQMQAIFKS